MAGLVALSAATIVEEGFPKRFQRMLDLADPENKNNLCLLSNTQPQSDWGGRRCLVNNVAGPVALLWGDSFAAHYLPAFLARGDNLGFNLLQYNLEGCPAYLSDDLYDIKVVILAARWQAHFGATGWRKFDAIAPTIKWLHARGIRVAVMGQSPTFETLVPRSYWWRIKGGKLVNPNAKADPGHAFNARLKDATAGAVFLEPSLALCTGPAACTIGEGLQPYYWDTGHFTTTGSIRAMEPLWPALDRFMRVPALGGKP
jgi:hypothetical protein